MLLVTFLAKSFPFGSAEIQMHRTIHDITYEGLNYELSSINFGKSNGIYNGRYSHISIFVPIFPGI